jgi:hypothetical protein
MVELPLVVEEGLVTKSGIRRNNNSCGRSFAFAGVSLLESMILFGRVRIRGTRR